MLSSTTTTISRSAKRAASNSNKRAKFTAFHLILARILMIGCFMGLFLNLYVHHSLANASMTMNRPTLGMDRLPSLANDNDTAQRRLGLDDGFALERLKTNLEQATSHCRGLSLRGAPTLLRRLQQYTASSNQFRCQRTVRDSRQQDVLHEYAIIATTSLFNPRTVLVNCLKWLLDANVQQIWILVQMEHYDGLRNDEEYGSRLLHWNDMNHHPVKLVFADNLWQGIALVNAAAACNATIISWRNADEPWVGTCAEMEIATDLFRQRNHADLDSSILYASHGWMYHAPLMSNSKPWWCSGTKPTDDNDLHMSMVSFSKTTMDNHSATTAQNSFFVLDMNGLIFHRDSLCLLNHPVLGDLHQLTAFSWAASELALSILLVHLHDGFDMYEPRFTSPVLARTIGRRTVDQSTISALTATGNVKDNKHLRKQVLDYIGGLPWHGDTNRTGAVDNH